MGGFLGIGGSSAKTDRSNTLTGFSDLKSVFNFGLPSAKSSFDTGQNLVGAASSSLGKAGDYFSKLLSGNRSAVQQAVAPESNIVQSQSDAQRRQLATSGTARGGGVAGAQQQEKDATMAKIDNLLFGVRPEAAAGETRVGAAQGALAGTELATASNMLGLGERSASDLASISADSRKTSQAINQDMVGKASQAILNVMSAFA